MAGDYRAGRQGTARALRRRHDGLQKASPNQRRMEAGLIWLRAKGLAAAQKKSSRTAAEGLVGVAVSGTKGRCR